VSVRSRVNAGKCDIYVAFLVKVLGGELGADHKEISDLRYFTADEMEARADVPKLNTWIARRALDKNAPRFTLSHYKPNPDQTYELWF
jgi:NADH pyrophosphatase NudC (nudix superfamily)